MNAYLFVDLFGIGKANRIVDNVVCGATHYSEKTGSYYSSDKCDAVEIKSLIEAKREYKMLIEAKRSYEMRRAHWNETVSKAVKNDGAIYEQK